MANGLREQIREYYERAEDCARKAAAQSDPGLKLDFLEKAQRWVRLAQTLNGQPDDAPIAEPITIPTAAPMEPTAAESGAAAAMLSVRVFETESGFGWRVHTATKELLGQGTAETGKKARIEAFREAMTYILKDQSASYET